MSDDENIVSSAGGFLAPYYLNPNDLNVSAPLKDSLPLFTARRDMDIKWNHTVAPPPSRWQKRKWRWNGKIRGVRHSLALRIAPWLDRDWD